MDIHWKQEYTGDMEVRQRDGVTYLSYPRLERESAIVHGFSTRLGGVSEGCLGSMNLSFSRGDNPENVLENYRRISRAIGFPVESIVTSDQTHTTNVRQVGKEDCGCGVLTPRIFHDIDGLITNFHLPESTLVMLVSALAGKENILHAYEVAVQEKYRFFSFGDAMLIL